MKVALVRPFNKYSFSMIPPLGLGYLASTLRTKGAHNVFLYEAVRDNLSTVDDFHNFLTETKPHIVGIQIYSVDLPVAKEYLRCVKKSNVLIKTVVGGPHPSTVPEETISYFGSDLDFVIAGEGEMGLLKLVNYIEQGSGSLDKVPGLVWRDKKGGINKNEKEVVGNLDDVPWPDWKLLDPRLYAHAPLGGISKSFPVAPIIVSRGCPYKCTFCAAKTIYGTGFRYRNMEDVISEIKYLQDKFSVKEIMIQDDNITFKKDIIMDFCENVRILKIDWNCLNGIRLNTIDDEVAQTMKDAGCYAVAVGIESGSQKILDDMKKKLKLQLIRDKVNILAKYGIKITGQFIIGYPTETYEDIMKTIRFARELPLERAAFANFMPLPGSQVYDDLKEQGKLDNIDFGDMSYYNVIESFTPHLSKSELDKLLKKAVRSFYLRPSILISILRSVGSFSNLFNLLKRYIKNYL